MREEINVSPFTLIFAFRYALGRRSSAVSIVVDDLIKNWDKLTDFEKQSVKEEIEKAIDERRAGEDVDIREWRKILDL